MEIDQGIRLGMYKILSTVLNHKNLENYRTGIKRRRSHGTLEIQNNEDLRNKFKVEKIKGTQQ